MNKPHDNFLPFLHTIETTILRVWEEFPSLDDKDVEFALEKLKGYFKLVNQGKSPDEPETSSERRQVLMDEMLNMIEFREELGGDIHLINSPNFKPTGSPIPSLAAMYVMCLNTLINSVQFWRKEWGPKGYLTFIKAHVPR